jgi:hypothetical protein
MIGEAGRLSAVNAEFEPLANRAEVVGRRQLWKDEPPRREGDGG